MKRDEQSRDGDRMLLMDELYQILWEEVSAYDYLAETLEQKQKAIVDNEVETIETLTGTEQMVIRKANRLNHRRQDLIRNMFNQNALPGQPVSLSDFIRRFGAQADYGWKALENRLNDALERIVRKNAENKRLIALSLSMLKERIGIIYPVDDNAIDTYNKQGVKGGNARAKSLVNCNI